MAETSSLLLLTQGTFKEQAWLYQHLVPENCKMIFASPYSLDLVNLTNYCNTIGFDINNSLNIYMLALITLKVTQDAPLQDNKGLEYFETINYFITYYPQYSTNIMKTYFSALVQEISASDDLFSWVQKLLILKVGDNEVQPIRQCLKIRYSSKVNSMLVRINENAPKKEIFELIDLLALGLQYQIDLNDIINLTISIILEKNIYNNDLRGFRKYLGQVVKVDLDEVKEILNKVKIFQILDQDNTEKIKFIEGKISSLSINIPQYIKKPKQNFQAEELNPHGIDWGGMQIESVPFYSRETGKFRVLCYHGFFSKGGKFVKKTYMASVKNADFAPIYNEINILGFLSNRAKPENSFLKFYGSAKSDNIADLYMEAGGTSLMNELTNLRSKGCLIEKDLAERWIISLLNSFAELSNHKIYHCDIKPHNILVKEDKTLKIIDFSVSMKTDENETMLVTMENPIQGTRGYMAPELQDNLDRGIRTTEYKAGKADVFSLGLTILQILTFNNYEGLNRSEKNKELHEKVNSILGYPEWIKVLLHKMLQPQRKDRISFNKCLQYIQFDNHFPTTINN